MRVLVVEDDTKIAGALKKGLEGQSYSVDVQHDSDGAMHMLKVAKYDAAVIDRMLPGELDGTGIIREMRSGGINTPVLMLTARGALVDRISGLDSGADDYLVKPFSFDELLARLRALLRRPESVENELKTAGDIVIDLTQGLVTRQGAEVGLSKKEFAVLEIFIRNPNQVVSKEQLIEKAWAWEDDVLPNTVEAVVKNMRKKLEVPFGDSKVIHTVRGFGYKFVPVEPANV